LLRTVLSLRRLHHNGGKLLPNVSLNLRWSPAALLVRKPFVFDRASPEAGIVLTCARPCSLGIAF
jgi:hypothetical protein